MKKMQLKFLERKEEVSKINKLRQMSKAKEQRGITLIALIVTIIVLLVLSGITISLVFSDNGIIANAREAQSKQADATVKEAILMAWSDYQIIINKPTGAINENEIKIASIAEVRIQAHDTNYISTISISFWDFLREEKGYIDEDGIIDVKALTGATLSKGNGVDKTTDIYVIKKVENTYILKYCGEDGKETILWEVNVEDNGSSSDTYPEATPEDLFIYSETEDGIEITGIKRDSSDFYQIQGKIKDIVIPRTINGKPVVALSGFSSSYYIKSVTIPETVEMIGGRTFHNNYELERIIFYNGKNEKLIIPDDKWRAEEKVQIIGKDGELLK